MASGLFGGGGGSGSNTYIPATYAQGGSPAAYVPQNPGGADTNFQSLFSNLMGAYNAGTTPPQVNYPMAESLAAGLYGSPYYPQAQNAESAFWPQESILGQGAINTAGNFATLPQEAAQLGYNTAGYGSQVAGYAPQVAGMAPQVAALAPQVAAGIAPLQQGANTILSTGYDPQGELRNQLLNQTAQGAAAANAASGVQGPYAAAATNQAMDQARMAWENQQLARQQAALGAAGSAYGQAGNLGREAGGLYGEAGNLYGQAGNLYGQAGNLNSAAVNQLGAAPTMGSNILGLGTAGTNAATSAAQGPLNLQENWANQVGPLLAGATNIGQQQYNLPLDLMNSALAYIGRQNAASGAALQGGGMGYNQAAQNQLGIGNLASGLIGSSPTSNLLFGSQGLSGALGLDPTTGLLGGLGGGAGGGFMIPGTSSALDAGAFGGVLDLGTLFA